MYQEFISSYQTCQSSSGVNQPFAYANPDGSIKLITNVVNSINNGDDEIFALSMAEDGFMEFLAFCDA
jgi:hypothetical protein